MEKKLYVSPTTEAYEIKQNICEFVQSGEGDGAAKESTYQESSQSFTNDDEE